MSDREPTSAEAEFRSHAGGALAATIRRTTSLPFHGKTILVVEDEYLIAEDVAATLKEAGATVVGPAASLPEAQRIAAAAESIDAAVLNIDLGGIPVFPLVDELLARGVRVMFLTGYADIPRAYEHVHCCRKPMGPARVAEELKTLLLLTFPGR